MNQSSSTSRPLIWEDEASAESRFRRVQQGVPRGGRALPGMPLETEEPGGDDPSRSDRGRPAKERFGAAPSRWWWPVSTVARVFLALGVVVVLSGITTAGDLLKNLLERDSRFRIAGASHIQATGLTEVSRAQMLPVFGEDIGRNIFFVPLNERRKELEALPWVQHATVMRVLPDQIRVNLVERQPVAFTRQGLQIGLVDASGVLLDMSPATMAEHHYSFPVVTGIDAGDKPASRQARMAVYAHLMAELDANNQHFSEQISEIDLTDPEDARVLMPAQGADILAHFGEDHFLERYQRYKAHIAEWRQQYPKLAAVDLRYEDQVVLEMASGMDATQPAGTSADDVKSTDDAPATAATSKAASASGKPVAKAVAIKAVTGKSASAKTAPNKATVNKPALGKLGHNKIDLGKTAPGRSGPSRAASSKAISTKGSKEKPGTKSSGNNAVKAKAAATKNKAVSDKKPVQAKAMAVKLNNKKPSPTSHSQAAESQAAR